MPSAVLRRMTFANVIACLALFFSLSGGAFAATHYVIKSKKQISPKVRKQLQGPRGKTGPAGPAGAAGAPGAAGAAGAPGSARAYAQVVSSGGNFSYAAAQGFTGAPQHPSTGVYCLAAPAGVDVSKTPLQLTISGGAIGFITQSVNNNCNGSAFQVETGDANGNRADVNFNVLVP